MSSSQQLTAIIDKIVIARVGLLLKHPFFGNLAARLIIKDGSDWCNSAATDGRTIFFNQNFFAKLSVSQIQFVLAHEILHNAFNHMGRLEGRIIKIFNYAADFCVNGQLIRDKIGDWNIDGIDLLHDTNYYGMSAEEVYDILKEHNDDMLDQLGDMLDQHIDWELPDDTSEMRTANGQPVYTAEELRQIRSEVTEAIMAAATAVGNNETPASIQRIIQALISPTMDWRSILQQQIQSTVSNDYSWMRPNRKSWHLSANLPGNKLQDTIDICVSIDMSGSITNDQALDFISEIKGIMEEYQTFQIKVWCFDTAVYNEQDFDQYNISDFDKYQPIGGGGTDFTVNWSYMKEQDIIPQKLIIFTDGFPCGAWGDPDYCDTIFVIHGSTTISAPFGTTCYYE